MSSVDASKSKKSDAGGKKKKKPQSEPVADKQQQQQQATLRQQGEALIRSYFAANCAPNADLRLLESIITDDVQVDYPSGSYNGKEEYLAHVAHVFEQVDCNLHDSVVFWNESDASRTIVSEPKDKADEPLEISVVYEWRGHLTRAWWLLACVPLCWPCVGYSCCCAMRKAGRNTYRFRLDAATGKLRICRIQTKRSVD